MGTYTADSGSQQLWILRRQVGGNTEGPAKSSVWSRTASPWSLPRFAAGMERRDPMLQ